MRKEISSELESETNTQHETPQETHSFVQPYTIAMDLPPLSSYVMQLSASHKQAIQLMLDLKQDHIFARWEENQLSRVRAFCDQVLLLDQKYPGGLAGYQKNAIRLLKDSRDGVNPLDGYSPEVPTGDRLQTASPEFYSAEEAGMDFAMKGAAFVLVAGGLGERLGYNGIKISLPIDLITEKTFIQYYVEYILAFQDRCEAVGGFLPLVIMTSGDTHDATVALLKEHNNFGMREDQITIIKQEQVPSIANNDCHFVSSESDPYRLETKPHGHGDVHSLLYIEGIISRWKKEGRDWVIFFQDTNALVFKCIPAALGTSYLRKFDSNSITVPRTAKEAVGGIVKLVKADGSSMTCNVEYNQLEPMLKNSGFPQGDVADVTGFSPYPGNINVLIFNINSYHEALQKTNGQVPEFVNPKYSNPEKTIFTKPTRLECMMQDFTRLFQSNSKVGFTMFDRWLCFSPVKNNPADAAKKIQSNLPPESASSCESDLFTTNIRLIRLAGVLIEEQPPAFYLGIPVRLNPKIHLAPGFAATIGEVVSRFHGGNITARSTLILDGDIDIQNLVLDGTLIAKANLGTSMEIKYVSFFSLFHIFNFGAVLYFFDTCSISIPFTERNSM
eukprot:TRINITY_DN3455_c0_g1_i6.p1 TRINITY_DN3455_c0_g1~~TRINITY_DN3455_c0_g1_i6.p1  ORF type:complete len:615 (-),score=118.16 TRINITY_DN3455_c0_g1_i6:745-2589(-)